MSHSNSIDVPKIGKDDVLHASARAVIGSVPVVGAAGVELFNLIVGPPLERRRDAWMKEIAERIKLLEVEHGVSFEELQNDESFIDTLVQATQVAIRNSQAEKREALYNAVTNSALPHSPDEAERQMFLNMVDKFTVWHLRILKFFCDPTEWFRDKGREFPNILAGGLGSVLEAAFEELAGRREFYDHVWNDLSSSGLTNTQSLHAMITASGLRSSRCNNRGLALIEFISAPKKTG